MFVRPAREGIDGDQASASAQAWPTNDNDSLLRLGDLCGARFARSYRLT
jgi:hypothetical protein